MAGLVILFTLLSILTFLSIANRRWMMFALLLFGGLPFGVFAPDEIALGLAFGGLYLLVVLCSMVLVVFFSVPELLSFGLKYYGFVLFLLYGLISILWTPSLEYGARVLLKLASPFLFLGVMQIYLKSDKDIKLAERIIIICCLVESVLALVNTFGHGMFNRGKDALWISKNLLSPVAMGPANFSCLIGIGALLSLAKFIETRKSYYLLLYAILASCIFWAFVRITIVALVISSIVVFVLLARNYAVKILVPVSIVFMSCLFTMDVFKSRMFFSDKIELSTVMHSDLSKLDTLINTSGRSTLWRNVNKKFFQVNPVFGSGVGSVDYWLDSTLHVRLHGEYLRILSDLGIVGLMLYLFAIFQFYMTLVKLCLRNKNTAERNYVVVALAGITFYLITLATDNSLNYISEFGLYVYTLIAFVLVKEKMTISSLESETGITGFNEKLPVAI